MMALSQLKCKHMSHNNQDIIAACTSSDCNKPKLCCFDCLTKDKHHNQHSEQIIQLTNFNEWKQSSGKIIEQIEQLIIDQDNLSELLKQIVIDNQKAININVGFATSSEIEESINLINKIKNIGFILQNDIDQLSQSIHKIIKELKQQKGQQISIYPLPQPQIIEQQQKIIPAAFENIKFRFSQQYKDSDIRVSDEGQVAQCQSLGFCLCEPVLPRNAEITFAIKYIQGNIVVGICKDVIRKDWHQPDLSDIGHGFYLIDNYGNSYSNHLKEINGKQQQFQFSKNQIIMVKVDIGKEKISWMNEQTKEKYSMQLNQQESDYYFCVYLTQLFGPAQVQIVDYMT